MNTRHVTDSAVGAPGEDPQNRIQTCRALIRLNNTPVTRLK